MPLSTQRIQLDQKIYIAIALSVSATTLLFMVRNSFRISSTGDRVVPDGAGLGLANTRKRLELLYGQQYTLEQWADDEVLHEYDFSYPCKAMKTVNCLIVDDEPIARAIVKLLVATCGLSVVADSGMPSRPDNCCNSKRSIWCFWTSTCRYWTAWDLSKR